jgi:hypothetical protein
MQLPNVLALCYCVSIQSSPNSGAMPMQEYQIRCVEATLVVQHGYEHPAPRSITFNYGPRSVLHALIGKTCIGSS